MLTELPVISDGTHDLSAGPLTIGDLQERLSALHLAQIVHKRRVILVIEGPEGAGKKRVLQQIVCGLDPCHFLVHPIAFDRRAEGEGHWLARYWTRLPAAGTTAIFFHSWYRRVLDDRLLGRVAQADWTRAYDEINEFEAQQNDYGTLLIKLYITVSGEVQARRLAERSADPWKRLTTSSQATLTGIADPQYGRVFEDLLGQTNTRWAPWTVISGDDHGEAGLLALAAIVEALTKSLPAAPPALANEAGAS